jgi:hypothetical protein
MTSECICVSRVTGNALGMYPQITLTGYLSKRSTVFSVSCGTVPVCTLQINCGLNGVNRTANGALRHEAHRLYWGVLYSQNVIRFNGTRANLISFWPIRKAQTSLRRFSRKSQILSGISTKYDKVWIIGLYLIYAQHENMAHKLPIFTKLIVDNFFFDTRVTELYPNRRKILENRAKCHCRPYLKRVFHCTESHSIHRCSAALYDYLPYQTSPTLSKKYGQYGEKLI